MTDEFEFFSNDCNNIITISSNNNYNLMKYNAVIMLKEILKHI